MEFLGSLVLCVLAALALVATVIFLLYWYERLNSPADSLNPPPFTVFTVLRMWVTFITVECTRPVLFLVWFLRQKKKPNPFMAEKNLSRPPVVLVHGIYDAPATWALLAPALEKAGFRVVTFKYSTFRYPIEKAVKDFNEFMYLTEASFPDQKFLFIGHSLGGLVLRAWLAEPGNEQKALGLVALASPHKGSRTAVFGVGKVAPCLVPGSSFLKALEVAPALPFPCLAIASGADEMVVPGSSLLPPEGWKLSVINNVGHLELIYRAKGIRYIMQEISALFPVG